MHSVTKQMQLLIQRLVCCRGNKCHLSHFYPTTTLRIKFQLEATNYFKICWITKKKKILIVSLVKLNPMAIQEEFSPQC